MISCVVLSIDVVNRQSRERESQGCDVVLVIRGYEETERLWMK